MDQGAVKRQGPFFIGLLLFPYSKLPWNFISQFQQQCHPFETLLCPFLPSLEW